MKNIVNKGVCLKGRCQMTQSDEIKSFLEKYGNTKIRNDHIWGKRTSWNIFSSVELTASGAIVNRKVYNKGVRLRDRADDAIKGIF